MSTKIFSSLTSEGVMLESEWLIAVGIKPDGWIGVLEPTLKKFSINNPFRIAAFLAQTSHESSGYTRLVENLNYSAEGLLRTFPKYFPDIISAREFARKPEMIANKVYGGRMGNALADDGWKFRGRGLIQTTGRTNYESVATELGLDCVEHPELLEQRENAALSAGLFWYRNGCNALADNHMFKSITQRINGGIHGLADRTALWNQIKGAMKI